MNDERAEYDERYVADPTSNDSDVPQASAPLASGNGGGGGGGNVVCCSVLYAAYYAVSSPRHVTVLASSLTASPAWLDMVRQTNGDVVCDSTAWTDFSLTTEAAYPTDGELDPTTGETTGNDTSAEQQRHADSAAADQQRGGDGGNCIPRRAKRVLSRYFYDEFCYRLATDYGVPTLTVFRDRLKRGVRMDEHDRDHRWFVDAMLSGTRFVAAMEIKRPTVERQRRPDGTVDTSVETGSTTVHDTRRAVVEPSDRRRDRGGTYPDAVVADERDDDSCDRRENTASAATACVSPHSTELSEFRHDDEYMFDDEDFTAAATAVLPTDPVVGPRRLSVLSESDINRMFDQYETELREKGSGRRRAKTAIADRGVSNDDDGDHEGALFKRPLDVAVGGAWRNEKGDEAKKRRKYNHRDDDAKENAVATGRERSDASSSDDDTRRRTRPERRIDDDDDTTTGRFAVVGAELVEATDSPANAHELYPDTVLLLYRLERRTDNTTRFVRVSRVAASRSTPAIELDAVSWNCDELLAHLKTTFGESVKWLGRRRRDTDRFQLRHLQLDDRFDDTRSTLPHLAVLLRRPASFVAGEHGAAAASTAVRF